MPDGPAVQSKRRELASLKCFFEYHKLSLQRQHQESQLADDIVFTADPAEMLHVYEALLQNAQAMVDLNNQDDKQDDYNPGDDPYYLEAQAHVIRIRAIRCFQLARVYESPTYMAGTTMAQASALLSQSHRLQRRAVEELAACDLANPVEEEKYHTQLRCLKVHIQAMAARVESSRFLEQEEKNADTASALTSKTTNRPLWLRLKDLDSGTVLVDDDPSPLILPIPCKPIFYDVAWERVTDTMASSRILDEFITANEPKKSSAGSFFGWFS